MLAILLKRFCLSTLYYYLLLWSVHRIYHAALKMFKIYNSTAVDSNDDQNQTDYSSDSSGSEADW